MPEPVDEKTPVSTYNSEFHVKIRDAKPPRPAATRLSHLPIHPRPSSGLPKTALFEPSVVIDPGDRAEALIETQAETLYGARRRYARTMELTLVAGISALLAAAVTLWLAADPAISISPKSPAAIGSLVPEQPH